MRIGVLTSVGQTIDAFFPDIIDEWRRIGHTVSAAAGTAASFEVRVIPGLGRHPRDVRPLQAMRGLRGWAKDEGLEVIVTNTAVASAVVRSVPLHVPVVYFCHGLHWDQESMSTLPWRGIERLLLRRSNGLITLNRDDQAWMVSRDPAKPQIRLATGVGLDPRAYPRTAPPPGQILELCWIGEFSHRKRPGLALEVAKHLKELRTDFQLTMVGDGDLLGDVEGAVRENRLDSHVTLVGRQLAGRHIANAHAVLHTATWEGLPRVLLEAASVGRASFAFDVKGCRDVPAVELIRPGEARAMAQRIASWNDGGRPLPSLPEPSELSYEVSARIMSDFLKNEVVSSGVRP